MSVATVDLSSTNNRQKSGKLKHRAVHMRFSMILSASSEGILINKGFNCSG